MSQILVGNAPCSWGALEFEETRGTRPIPYDQMLDELAEAGYTGSELGDWGYMPTEPDGLAAAFRRRGLDLTGAFVGIPLKDPAAHGPGQERVLEVARLLAQTAERLGQSIQPYLVLADDNGTDPVRVAHAGRVSPEMGLSDPEWRVFARGVERIARAVREETGLPTVFHHHCAGYVETPWEIDELLGRTDPELVGLVFDTGHYAFGAGGCHDLLSALRRYGDRVWYVHFKDFSPAVGRRAREEEWDYFQAVQHGVFCRLGEGCVDFPGVVAWLRSRGYRGYVTVEQDVLPGMGSPKENALRNRAYLRSIGL